MAWAASPMRASGPRQDSCTRRLPSSTSRTRLARSGPTGALIRNDCSDRAEPTVEYGGKVAGSPELQPMHTAVPAGVSSPHAVTRVGPPTLSSTRSSGSSTWDRSVITCSAPSSVSSAAWSGRLTSAMTVPPA